MFKIIKYADISVNFVDSNNNFVGYSLIDDCCSYGDWFIDVKENSAEPENIEKLQQELNFDSYIFDENYFKEIEEDEFKCIIFKIVSDEKPLFLHLFNVHNGYYAKGFKCTFGEKREGGI